MAQFKNFLIQMDRITESSKLKAKSNLTPHKKVKAVSVIGGAKTDTIGSSAIKPPRGITLKRPNPRGIPSNRTHAKSVPIKEQNIDEASKALTITATKVPSKSKGPEPIKLKRTNPSDVGSPKPSARTSSQKSIGDGLKTVTIRKNTAAATPIKSSKKSKASTADAIFTGISNRPLKGKKPKKKSILSKAMGILAKKSHATAHPKGFIHPPISKTAK